MAAKLHKKKVVAVLLESFPDLQEFLEQTPSGRVTGVVVSAKFDLRDHAARQRVLWRAFKAGLSEAELSKVGTIAALTPAEAEVPA